MKVAYVSCIGSYFKKRKVWRFFAVVFRADISVRLFKIKKKWCKGKNYVFSILGQYAFSPIYDGYPSPSNL